MRSDTTQRDTTRAGTSQRKGPFPLRRFRAPRSRRAAGAALAGGAMLAALLSGGTATARPADSTDSGLPARTDGLQGPVVTHPASSTYEYPAGEVCPFAARAEFPVSDLTLKTWTDRDGDPVFAVESGALVLRATNLETGRSVERDASGTGTLVYSDPSTYVLSGNDWVAGFHTGDSPEHRWIVASDFMSVRISTTSGHTTRQLLGLRGAYEDLCETLA
ncbi:hypothetical protein [Streptomyces palmae]|uniref:Uncharacterized protein n=1 Tax=Streptomyces palmae TaxID=1701085 RepID=A0A4Z0HBA8_9ACTN|nr:hypothetical protein [Streptomyces palmae]TGB14168.1 hypothetical protein E4099_08750 [Streptomyces palmae]